MGAMAMREIQPYKCLVTGGAGFIGSHIVDALIDGGHQVAVVDNLYTGSESNLNPRAQFYKMNILDDELSGVFERERPEIVFHLAAHTIVSESVEDPFFDAEQNILGSLRVIRNCVRFGVKKIVYASTGGAVYGEVLDLPPDEMALVDPISPYGISKHTVERYLAVAGVQDALRWIVLRYANVYGPRQNAHGEAGVVASRDLAPAPAGAAPCPPDGPGAHCATQAPRPGSGPDSGRDLGRGAAHDPGV
jgi:UDP-glucose 4-epimerase